MGQTNFGRDRCRRWEMIRHLVRQEIVMRHVLSHEGPHKVEAGGVFVFVLDPASLFQSAFHVTIAALNDEHFGVSVDPILLFPLLHVGDVEVSRLIVRLVPLQEVVEGVIVVHKLLLLGSGAENRHLLLLLVPLLLETAVLLLTERRKVLHIFCVIEDFLPGEFLQFLFPLCLSLRLLLLFQDFVFDGLELLLLPFTDGLGTGFPISRLL